MRRFLPYILIVFTLVNFLAPVSIGLSEKNRVVVEKNVASAEDIDWTNWDSSVDGYKKAFPDSSIYQTSSVYTPSTDSSDVTMTLKIGTGVESGPSLLNWMHMKKENSASSIIISISRAFTWNLIGDRDMGTFVDKELLVLKVTENDTGKTGWIDVSSTTTNAKGLMDGYLDKSIDRKLEMPLSIVKPITFQTIIPSGGNGLSKFKPGGVYSVDFYYLSSESANDVDGGETIPGLESDGSDYYKIATTQITVADAINQVITTGIVDDASKVNGVSQADADTMPECSLGILPGTTMKIGGCFAQLIYYALFVPTSYIFALAGNFFDWTFAYSVNDASYRSGFVVQGWGVVRDFCNMFFIFVLLYVAFTTILGTQDAKTKEMIVHVVLIGLLINFSLFATQIIIDASNILARVFYNSNTIVITPNGSTVGQIDPLNTTPSDPAGTGIIPLSAALVNKINPQNLIINAKSVNDFSTESNIGVAKNASNDTSLSAGRFIIVTLLAIAVNVVGFVVFISVAFLFVGRVIMLWIAMILSPAVFFTYMVPKLKNMEMIGWTKWWPETISLAFLAPVFIFFMYLILKFLETKIVFIDSTGKTGIQMVIAVMVPFVFIMVLLLKAKKIATQLAGTMGEMAAKAGSAVSGLALGAATGGAALAMRGSIGKYASGVANDEALKEKAKEKGFGGAIARAKLKTASYTSKASFDVRNTAAGQAAGKELGVDLNKQASWVGLGTKNTKDGYAGGLKRKGERDAKDSENLKQSISAGADQDDKAKKWNADYNDDLVREKTAWETANPGKIFDEGQHKRDYEKANGTKVRTSDEENKQRFADKASDIEYGAGYLEKRDEAKETARLAATSFNEGAWRKTKNINKRTNLSDRENLAVKDLRSKSNPEKPPLNETEKSNANKSITKAQIAYDNAHTELQRADGLLKEVATQTGNDIDHLTKKDIDSYLNTKTKTMTLVNGTTTSVSINEEIAMKEAELTNLTAQMKTKAGQTSANTILLAKLNEDKRKLNENIKDFNSLLSNKTNQQSIKVQQSSIIKEKNDDLARG